MATPPALESFFKNLDIINVYKLASPFWDFLIFFTIFYQIAKRGLAGGFALPRHGGREAARSFWTGVTPENEQKQMVRGLAFTVALACSVMLTVFAKISLEFLFTSGIFSAFMALLTGIITYNAVVFNYGEDKKLTAFITAVIFGSVIYAVVSFRHFGLEWLYSLLPLVIIMGIIMIVLGMEKKGDGRDVPARLNHAQGDISSAMQKYGDLEKKFETVQKDARAANREHPGILNELKSLAASMAQSAAIFTAVSTQVAAAPPKARPPVVEREKPAAKAKPVETPAETGLPTPPPPPAPPAEVMLPTREAEKVVKKINIDAAELEAAQDKLAKQIQRFTEIAELLEKVPTDIEELTARAKKAEEDLNRLEEQAKRIAVDVSKKAPELVLLAEQLRDLAIKTNADAQEENRIFKERIAPLKELLATDGTAIQQLSAELNQKLNEILDKAQIVIKRSYAVKQKDVSLMDVEQYLRAYELIERLISDTIQMLEAHGGPDALLASLSGLVAVVETYPQSLTRMADDITILQGRWQDMDAELQKVESAGKAKSTVAEKEAKAEGIATEELKNVQKQLTLLSTLLTGIQKTDFEKMSGNKLQKWFRDEWGPFYSQLSGSIMELTRLRDDLQGLLTEFGNSIVDSEKQKIQAAIRIINQVLSKEMVIKPVCDAIENLRKAGPGEDQKQMQKFVIRLQEVPAEYFSESSKALAAEMPVIKFPEKTAKAA